MAESPVLCVSRNPEDVIMRRHGSVLGKKTVLKSDHFPGCQNKKITPHIDGAPNFRQIAGIPVYGVAIPTVEGIRNVLHIVGASREPCGRQVLWHNMREEPVIYINGRPFVLREVERPFTNLEYTGIDRERVEAMEERLKEDVLLEAARYSNKIMVSDELDDGQMVDMWEPVGPDRVQTPLEVYQAFQAEGYSVAYHRVPVTDEKSPKERDFDLLVSNLATVDSSTAQIFNCQMGRGRTTTGIVVATLLALHRWPQALAPFAGAVAEEALPGRCSQAEGDETEEVLRKGNYTVIRSVVRVLEGGAESKRLVDSVIDRCAAMQNLREAILGYRNAIHKQADERRRQAALSNFVEYLERYYFLICFAAFLHHRADVLEPWASFAAEGQAEALGGPHKSKAEGKPKDRFQEWMKARPELYSILRRLLRRDPMGALSYGRAQHAFLQGQEGKESAHAAEASGGKSAEEVEHILSVVRSRQGAVLGRETVLKADHCPGCQSDSLPERIEGAPNFRGIPGFRVYGVACPTEEGIRSVLERLGARAGGGGRRVVWHNMREEATVYIEGQPFVLREAARPFKNMREYSGIDQQRVEAMEARLKEDVLAEAQRNAGAVVVSHETDSGAIFQALLQVISKETHAASPPGAASVEARGHVRTPLEVFQSLQREGYDVEYARLPITDGRAPKNRDLDAIASRVGASDPDTAFVFNCQMGRGRTTTGTVVATLVLLRCLYGAPLSVPHHLQRSSSQGNDSSPGGAHSAPVSPAKGLTPEKRHEKRPRLSEPEVGDGGSQDGVEGAVRDVARKQRLSVPDTLGSQVVEPVEADLFGLEDIPAVRRIMRLLERGEPSRRVLDAVIDACAAMQNIREAVLRYRQIFNQQTESASVRQFALNRGVEYLERYITLIAFTAYLNTPNFIPSGTLWPSGASLAMEPHNGIAPEQHLSFKDWMKQKPEIRQMRISMRLRPSRVFTIPDDDAPRLRSSSGLGVVASDLGPSDTETENANDPVVMEAVVRSRCGSVLTRSSILKLYHFPGLKTRADESPLAEVPNFFQAPGLPLCSMATPTIAGARTAVREVLSSGPRSGKGALGGACEVRIMDLREEAVVYIRGQPYVLRDMEQPGGPLKHVGIEGPMVELMERRLKDELLQEAARMGGKVLLHREEEEEDDEEEEDREGGVAGAVDTRTAVFPETNQSSESTFTPLTWNGTANGTTRKTGGQGHEGRRAKGVEMVGLWCHVAPEDVKTPAEVYQQLQSQEEGLNVQYSRIPLTRDRIPQTADVDAIQRCMDGSKPCVKYLLVSHTGYGAIAYAMSVASLRLKANAAAPTAEPSFLTPCLRCTSPSEPSVVTELEPVTGMGKGKAPLYSPVVRDDPQFPAALLLGPVPTLPSFSVDTPPVPANAPAAAGVPPSSSGTSSMLCSSSSGSTKKAPSMAELGLLRGEYRSVLSLERLLVQGPACKAEVDNVLESLRPIGNVLGDILEYKRMTESLQGEDPLRKEQRALLHEMGIKALQRYCYLIVFRAYLHSQVAKKGHTMMEEDTFEKWVADRPEITHLCQHLGLG